MFAGKKDAYYKLAFVISKWKQAVTLVHVKDFMKENM